MTSSKSRPPFSQKDIRLFLRLLPLLGGWKIVLLLVIVGLVVQYARNLPNQNPGGAKKPDAVASEKTDAIPTEEEIDEPEVGEQDSSREEPEPVEEPEEKTSADASSKRSTGILDLAGLSDEKLKFPGTVIEGREGEVIFKGTVDLKPTLVRIDQGKKLSFSNDGATFGNREKRLPRQPTGHYREWVHPTKGYSGPGPQRVVTGDDREIYYTPDHYKSFRKIR